MTTIIVEDMSGDCPKSDDEYHKWGYGKENLEKCHLCGVTREIETIGGFMCDHGEGKKNCEKILKNVYKRLDCDATNLLSRVVYSLNWDYGVTITGIPCDMWSAVEAESWWVKEGQKPIKVRIQCDEIEHGIARVWQIFADKFPEEEK
ncbi:MAG: hypothetical protein ACREOB_10405 [Thermodesulfobacteriota bacterium]